MKTYTIKRNSSEVVGRDCEGDLYGTEIVELSSKDPWIMEQLAALGDRRGWTAVGVEQQREFDEYIETYHGPGPEELAAWKAAREVEPPQRGSRASFVEALEDAFWSADGPELLRNLAKTNSLEFLRICARLIPVDAADKSPKGGLSISFNLAPEREEKTVVSLDVEDP